MSAGAVFLARVEDVLVPPRAGAPTSRAHASALLSSRERERWHGIRHPRRRGEFLSGRVLVKYLWDSLPELSPDSSAARQVSREALLGFVAATLSSRSARRRCRSFQLLPATSGVPELTWRGRGFPSLSVSLTHKGGWVAAALASGERVGIDLERVEPRSSAFTDLFTPAQRAWCAAQAHLRVETRLTLVWALREAAFKAGIAGSGDQGIVPRGTAPMTPGSTLASAWPLQPLAVELPGGGEALARIGLHEDLVLVHLALALE